VIIKPLLALIIIAASYFQTNLNVSYKYEPDVLWRLCNNNSETNILNLCNDYVSLNDSLFMISNDHNYLVNILSFSEINDVDFSKLNSSISLNEFIKLLAEGDIETLKLSNLSIFQLLYLNKQYSLHDKIHLSYTNNDPNENIFSNLISFYYYYKNDKYEKALSFIEVNELNELPYKSFRDRINQQIIYSLIQTRESSKLIYFLENQALPTARLTAIHNFDNYLYTLSKEYYSLGRYRKSLELLKKLHANSSKIPNIENEIAITYYKLGKYNQYVSFQLQAESIAYQNNDEYALLNIYRNLHIYHKYNTNWSTALEYLEKAKIVALRLDNSRELSAVYKSFGDFYWESDHDLENAILNLNLGLSLISVEENYYDYINLLNIKAKLYEESKNYSESINTLETIGRISKGNSNQKYYVQSQIDLAYIYLNIGKINEAKKIVYSINNYNLDQVDYLNLIRYRYTLAQLEFGSNKLDQLTSLANQVYERAQNSAISQGGYWNLEKEYYQIFQAATDEFINNDRFDDALFYLDRIKTINDANYFSNPLISSSKLTDEELELKTSLSEDLTDLRKRLLTASGDERIKIQTEIDRKTAQFDNLRNQVSSTLNVRKVPYWSVKNILSHHQAILHFTELDDAIYKTLITRQAIEIQKLPFDDEIVALYDSVSAGLSKQRTNLIDLHKVYNHLKLSDIPESIKDLIIIPDSHLLRIPLDILPTKSPDTFFSYGSARYLIEDYHTSYYSSIRELFENKRSKDQEFGMNLSAYGVSNFDHIKSRKLVPLPFAEKEIDEISDQLNDLDNLSLLTGDAASKANFLNSAIQSKVIHLATHSEVSNEDPLYSTLYFTAGSDQDSLSEDGTLYAYELYNLDLKSDLIFMNSCSSGSGTYMQGTGIMGINRALRYAGAKSLILNLWPVNDVVAADFAADFYDQLSKGKSKSEALREAKLNQLMKGSADPHFWGVYMLMGNPQPVFNSNIQTARMLPWVTFLFIGSLLFALWQRNRKATTY
jgi:CHAT domain-containing protein